MRWASSGVQLRFSPPLSALPPSSSESRRSSASGVSCWRRLAVQGEAQLAGHQRPGEIGAELVALPAEAVLAHAAIEQAAARPGIGGAPGDHVHHSAEGFRTVERGHRSAYHLDALDALHRHPAEVEVGMGDGPGRGGDPLAVHQHQGVLAGHAANADARRDMPTPLNCRLSEPRRASCRSRTGRRRRSSAVISETLAGASRSLRSVVVALTTVGSRSTGAASARQGNR